LIFFFFLLGVIYSNSSSISINGSSKFERCSSVDGDCGAIYAHHDENNCKFSISDTTLDNCISQSINEKKVQMIYLFISSYTSQNILFKNLNISSDSSKTLIFIKVNNYDNDITLLRQRFPDSCGWLNNTNVIFNKNDNTNTSLDELICDDNLIYVSNRGSNSSGCGWNISPCLTIGHSYTRLETPLNADNSVIKIMGDDDNKFTLTSGSSIDNITLTKKEDNNLIIIVDELSWSSSTPNEDGIFTTSSDSDTNSKLINLEFNIKEINNNNIPGKSFIYHKSPGSLTLKTVNIKSISDNSINIKKSIIVVIEGSLYIEDNIFKNLILENGDGCVINSIIKSNCITNITDCSFSNIFIMSENSYGGSIYSSILSGGTFLISGKKNNEDNTFINSSIKLRDISRSNDGDNDYESYGGAIALFLNDDINNDESFLFNGFQ
jgi:hypothetical protein